MSKTVRELSDAASAGTRRMGVYCFDSDNPILDATVYGLCETCGGSKVCPVCEGTGGLSASGEYDESCPKCSGTGACPDCVGTVSVMTKELRERAAAALYNRWPRHVPYENLSEANKDTWRASVDLTCNTVLGKTRVAKEVGRIHDSSPGDPTFYLWKEGDAPDVEGYEVMAQDIAILEDDEIQGDPR